MSARRGIVDIERKSKLSNTCERWPEERTQVTTGYLRNTAVK